LRLLSPPGVGRHSLPVVGTACHCEVVRRSGIGQLAMHAVTQRVAKIPRRILSISGRSVYETENTVDRVNDLKNTLPYSSPKAQTGSDINENLAKIELST
jgi:hypothetical protein